MLLSVILFFIWLSVPVVCISLSKSAQMTRFYICKACSCSCSLLSVCISLSVICCLLSALTLCYLTSGYQHCKSAHIYHTNKHYIQLYHISNIFCICSMLYSMTKKMIANIYLSLDFPKQNSIFANSYINQGHWRLSQR